MHNVYAGNPISIRYLGIDHGLSNNFVTSVFQDNNGFMWFGTYDGLNKYDGNAFTVFRNIIGDSTSLLDNHIYCIGSDNDNNLWIGGAKGLNVYNAAKNVFFKRHFKKSNSPVVLELNDIAFTIQKAGNVILVGTAHNGLIAFVANNTVGQQILPPENGNNNGSYSVSAIHYDSLQHNVWLCVNDTMLCKYDLKTGMIVKVVNSAIQCNAIITRFDGSVIIGNNTGLYKLDNNSLTACNVTPKINVRDIVEDKDHNLWIASDGNGLWYLPDGSGKAVPFAYDGKTINSNAIYDLYIDNEGRKWVGTLRGGINIIEQDNHLFKTISYNADVKGVDDFILSFCEDDKYNLWIGTDGAGLRYWNRQNNTFTRYVHSSNTGSISSNFITGIAKDSSNDIWVSTWFGGINRFNTRNNTFKHYACYNPFKKYEETNVWFIYEDNGTRLWASTTNNGHLYLYNHPADRFELFDSTLVNFQVMAEDRSGNLWGGNYNTLVLVDPIKKQHRFFDIGYPVRSIHEDKRHNFWIGTEGGGLLLFDRETGTYTRITTTEGLPNNAILRILEDDKANLWLSTYSGLCRFNPALKTFRNFTGEDGLQSNQFSFNAALISKNGAFLFGGIKGFNLFYPDSIYDKNTVPKLFLTGLQIDNKPVENEERYVTGRNKDILTGITIPFNKAVLTLGFTAPEYTYADKLKYAYFLKGWDKNWNIINNARTANYSRLREGEYTFYVKVMNADGIWGSEEQLLFIKVLPPWYRTWWSYILYAVIAGSAIYMYLLYNKRQERLKYEIKLARLDKEKEKELTERKIAFFTHISHEFRTPLTLIVNPLRELPEDIVSEQSRKKILTIKRNAGRLLSLVNQLLLFRKVDGIDQQLHFKKFDLAEACNEVFLSFTQSALSKRISFVFQKPESEIWINGDKEKIEIILFNLISNALKYTPAGGKVSFSVLIKEDMADVIVEDTGCGISGNTGKKLFDAFYQSDNNDQASQSGFGIGLYVSNKLAIAHSGRLAYTSEAGKGAIFTLTLPVVHKMDAPEPADNELVMEKQGIIAELVADVQNDSEEQVFENQSAVIDKVISGLPTMLIVDDSLDLRNYVRDIFSGQFNIYDADNGVKALEIMKKVIPDIVLSDVIMKKMDGIELCRRIKEDASLAHIPIILLAGSVSEQSKLRGIECGAEDYITKPFDKELIVARVQNILKSRSLLQQYFFNTITLQPAANITADHKSFLENCIEIVERHIDDDNFTVQQFCREIGLSHPALYKKIKAVSGLTVNVFIRYLRLRKAAELLINTNNTIVEITYITGFSDMRYFREQFSKLFGMNPSDYIKRYRKSFGNKIATQKK
ncbi:MAG: two-component regulator propeller domain-containing protein [Agriterribacter sp.]